MENLKSAITKTTTDILTILSAIPFLTIKWGLGILYAIFMMISGLFAWGGLILFIFTIIGPATFEQNWKYFVVGVICFIAREVLKNYLKLQEQSAGH